METKNKRAQTALEYVMIVGGAIAFVILVVLIVRGNLIADSTNKLLKDRDAYTDTYLKIYLFRDSFENMQLSSSNWITAPPEYVPENGKLKMNITGSAVTRSVFKDFSLGFKVRTSEPTVKFGVFFRSNGNTMYKLEFDFSPGTKTIYLYEVNGGINTPLGSYSGPTIDSVATSEVPFMFTVIGDKFNLYPYNNRNSAILTRTLPGPYYKAGSAGTYIDSPPILTGNVYFDDFSLWDDETQ
ncbi:hypothetical protein HY989_03265 [Candidatus Micrarchaeota archaeon]|nr:hypothetical protein [Candidatus Micrarchaeota archaeon]